MSFLIILMRRLIELHYIDQSKLTHIRHIYELLKNNKIERSYGPVDVDGGHTAMSDARILVTVMAKASMPTTLARGLHC